MGKTSVRSLDSDWGTDLWEEIDPWWDSHIDTLSAGLGSPSSHNLDRSVWTKEWEKIDPWWDAFADNQRQQIAKLRGLFNQINEEWAGSPSRFNRDPLTTDWTGGRRSHGPLRINHEEDWSHWLAYLLRASSGEFTRRLLSDEFETAPQSVRREVRFNNPDGTSRQIDILVEYEDSGLSIEVKRNDTNYEKTPETAALIDEQKQGKWTHLLLIPKHRSSRLRQHFSDRVLESQDDSLTIVSADYPDILVLHWETVSRTLRETLLANEESNPHWTSSAYLFVSLIEQHISSFEPVSLKQQRMVSDEEPVDAVSLIPLQPLSTVDVTEQLMHFERTLENHNE